MKKIREMLAVIVPKPIRFPLILALAFNMLVYSGSRIIAGDWRHYNIESAIDRMIPLWTPSVVVYLGCYVFWVVNYIMIAKQEKREVCGFFGGELLAKAVCLVFFLALPTTNIRPELEPDGIWNRLMIFVYSVDAADNLFPSIHCLVSWFSYIGLRGKKEISVWYRGFSCIMALLVCLSTLLTKQHVIADVFGGILLAEICFGIGKHTSVWKLYEKVWDKFNEKIFPEEGRI